MRRKIIALLVISSVAISCFASSLADRNTKVERSESTALPIDQCFTVELGATYLMWVVEFGGEEEEMEFQYEDDTAYMNIGDLYVNFDPSTFLVEGAFLPFLSLNYDMRDEDFIYLRAFIAAIEYGKPQEFSRMESRNVMQTANEILDIMANRLSDNFDAVMDGELLIVYASDKAAYAVSYTESMNCITLFAHREL